MKSEQAAVIRNIAVKYSLEDATQTIERLGDSRNVVIGVIGEFNAGKSTLLNAIIGENVLPAMPVPTTKSLTEICFEEGDTRYFTFIEGEYRQADKEAFQACASGQVPGVCRVVVNSTVAEYADVSFVDTPGLESLDDKDRLVTIAYLKEMDFLIFCHDISRGELTTRELDVLGRKEICDVFSRSMFVLTKCDQKMESANSAIFSSIAGQLRLLYRNTGEAVFAENSIHMVNAKRLDDNVQVGGSFTAALKQKIVSQRSKSLGYRSDLELRDVGEDVIAHLKALEGAIQGGAVKINRESDELKDIVDSLARRKAQEYERMARAFSQIRPELNSIASRTVKSLSLVKSEDVAGHLDEVSVQIQSAVLRAISSLKQNDPDIGLASLVVDASEVANRFESIERVVGRIVMVATAVATAAILPGGTAVLQAEEAAGGALVRSLASALASASTNDGKKGKSTVTPKTGLLNALGQAVMAINPFEYVGQWAAENRKEAALQEIFFPLFDEMAARIITDLQSQYQSRVIQPIEEDLYARSKSLASIRNEISNGKFDAVEKMHAIAADRMSVESAISMLPKRASQ